MLHNWDKVKTQTKFRHVLNASSAVVLSNTIGKCMGFVPDTIASVLFVASI